MPPTREKIEEEFFEEFEISMLKVLDAHRIVLVARLEDYVDSLLASQREEIEKLKKDDPWAYGFNVDRTDGYNQCIDDVLELLFP